MLGTFQQSQIRIEVNASARAIGESLLYPEKLRQWMFPQQISSGLPNQLEPGLSFVSRTGLITIKHEIETLHDSYLRLILSEAVDGYHEWCWDEGWVQSRLEGISLLPLNLAQTTTLLRLRQFLELSSQEKS
ncbi:hypothetical protein FRE64_01825 [Euhalothece natronophila Z-M001]|uniref:SRPBCC domain-containing protein n=1 Tax=Euhalothece natronophila Z-M001 TaxID=522448 RepID=A0A5B8NIK6_9CHRO|nr:hypothetical protein [Euhalothece natronophila]QDZ38787.1 hypothetical protein FRE64_01825 [Euhalothece natronophila Z-M001]